MGFDGIYPPVNVYITMENHHFYLENSLNSAIFSSYVELPEGTYSSLGGGLEHEFHHFHILGIGIPTDELIFSEGFV